MGGRARKRGKKAFNEWRVVRCTRQMAGACGRLRPLASREVKARAVGSVEGQHVGVRGWRGEVGSCRNVKSNGLPPCQKGEGVEVRSFIVENDRSVRPERLDHVIGRFLLGS